MAYERYALDWRPRFAEAYRPQNEAFLKFFRTGVFPTIANAWDGYCAALVAEAGVESLRKGGRVTIAKMRAGTSPKPSKNVILRSSPSTPMATPCIRPSRNRLNASRIRYVSPATRESRRCAPCPACPPAVKAISCRIGSFLLATGNAGYPPLPVGGKAFPVLDGDCRARARKRCRAHRTGIAWQPVRLQRTPASETAHRCRSGHWRKPRSVASVLDGRRSAIA